MRSRREPRSHLAAVTPQEAQVSPGATHHTHARWSPQPLPLLVSALCDPYCYLARSPPLIRRRKAQRKANNSSLVRWQSTRRARSSSTHRRYPISPLVTAPPLLPPGSLPPSSLKVPPHVPSAALLGCRPPRSMRIAQNLPLFLVLYV